MKVLEINWLAFLHDVETWMDLPAPARAVLSRPKDPDRISVRYELAEHHDILVENEFFSRLQHGGFSLKKERKPLLRIIRALKTNTALERPSSGVFVTYISNYLTHEERNALWSRPGGWRDDHELFRNIATVQWPNDFLAAVGPEWESRYQRGFIPPYFEPPEVLAMGQRLVKDCIERKKPLAFRELFDLYAGEDSGVVEAALMGCFRYLLLYPWQRSTDAEPVFGVWPGIVKRLNAKPPERPKSVEPDDVFQAPLLNEDMTTLLAATAAEPFRLRVSDSCLFAKAQKSMQESILRLPGWVSSALDVDGADRVVLALHALRRFGFVRNAGESGKDLCVEITEQGRKWLGLSAKQRLRRILDEGREGAANLSRRRRYFDQDEDAGWMPVEVQLEGKGNPSAALRDALQRQLSELPTEAYWKSSEFREYYSVKNSFVDRIRKGDRVTGYLSGRYFYRLTAEDLEEMWPLFLDRMIQYKLFPLGAVKVGRAGGELCVSLTDMGRYLFGLADDFEFEEAAGGGVLVQPNFEVAFLAPDPLAEAEIGRFAERKGHNVGILFVITKESVMRAAASGLTAGAALETLERFGTKALPSNVRREIEGWFGACRRITVQPAVLIHCPDPDTATRVLAVARDKAERLSDTVLELRNPAWQAALLRKLRGMGIFV